MNDVQLTKAEALIDAGRFDEAFRILQHLTQNKDGSQTQLGDAYQLMGSLVRILPSLGTYDECGLYYFKLALNFVPNHVGALFGIVSTYGKRFPDHQDAELALRAIQTLLELPDSEISESMRTEVLEKRKLLVTA